MLFPFRFPFIQSVDQSGSDWTLNLHPVQRFDEILRCERMRSDRSGIRFSTLVFSVNRELLNQRVCCDFTEHLRARMRATDHVGLLSECQVAVILWDTLEPGARAYLDTVKRHPSFECVEQTELYLYPTPMMPTRNDANARVKSAELSPSATSSEAQEPSVQPLEVLFIQKLPRWKRIIDIVGASAGLVLLFPLLAVTAILIKLTSRGPILFQQQRDGLGGQRFSIYKFRTMRADAERLKEELRKYSEQDGPAFKLTNDPRITPIGRYLRKTCIDELPQLWNVLKGEMTLVGPRPLDSKEAEKITGWGRRRLEVTPGLTCIWQVHGKSKVTFTEWMRMDIRYVKNRRLFRDLKLIWETIVAVVRHRASV